MADPIFTPEAPPAGPPKKRLSTPAMLALGCGVIFLLALGTCAGGMAYCGHKVSSMGQQEWTDLRAVAGEAMTDAGARRAYQTHPALAQAYPTVDDFVGATRLWRPALQELPAQMPAMFSGPNAGRVSFNTQYVNGESRVTLGFRLDSGKTLIGTWKNHQLADLQLE